MMPLFFSKEKHTTMDEPTTIIPGANHALREELFRFVQQQEVQLAERILDLLRNSPVELFTLVTRQVGAVGEPPITAADLALMELEDGRPLRMISASTKITPDNISVELAASGIYCRPIPAKQLLDLCLESGILGIELDGGLSTAVLIGPIALDKPLGLHANAEPAG
jgi:hypothetical protein